MKDKNGKEITEGCLVKVFHYTAALRRKKFYLYAFAKKRGRQLYLYNLDNIAVADFDSLRKCRCEDYPSEELEVLNK